MVVLRSDDEIDRRLAAADLLAFGLGDAARHDQGGRAALALALGLQDAQLAEFGEDLLRRALADVAGVEDDEVGVLDVGRLLVAFLAGDVGHPLRIIDVHLAAERLDERPAGGANICRVVALLGVRRSR